MMKCIILVLLAGTLAACSSSGKRPQDANLFEAITGLSSGEFEEQLESDRQETLSSRQALESEQAELMDNKSDLEATRVRRDELLVELEQVEKENKLLQDEISQMQADSEAALLKKRQRQHELEAIKQKVNSLKRDTVTEQEDNALYEERLMRLKQEVETLRSIILTK